MPQSGRARSAQFFQILLLTCSISIKSTSTIDYGIPIEIKLWDSGRTPLAHMVDVTNGFGLKVLAEHNFLNENNIAFSPYGLMGILVALFEGVDGEASFQLQRAMGLPWNRNTMRIGFRDIHRTLKTYFVPEEGFLAGLALNNENVTFNEGYKKILRFYGYDLDGDKMPTLPTTVPSSSTNATTAAMPGTTTAVEAVTTTAMPTTEDMAAKEEPSSTTATPTTVPETTTTSNAEIINDFTPQTMTISTVDSSTTTVQGNMETSAEPQPTTTSSPSVTTSEAMNTAEPVATVTTSPITTTVNTSPMTTTVNTSLMSTTVNTSPMTSTVNTSPMTTPTFTAEETTTMQSSTITAVNDETTINDEPTINNEVDILSASGGSTSGGSTSDSMSTMVTSSDVTSSKASSTETNAAMTESTTESPSTLETLERRKKSIVDFIFTNPSYLDDYYFYKSYEIPIPDIPLGGGGFSGEGGDMFLVNGLRNIQATYMSYDSVLDHAYLPHLEASALRLPLDSERYYLLVVLPTSRSPIDLGRLLARMARESDLQDVHAALRPRRVRALVPSFMVKGHVTLTTDLQKLGIREVFEPRQRDFSPMTRQAGVYVRSIEQAVSVAIRKYRADEPKTNKYVVNRHPVKFLATYPFLYFVMDSSIHVALMAGKMVDPLNNRIL